MIATNKSNDNNDILKSNSLITVLKNDSKQQKHALACDVDQNTSMKVSTISQNELI